MTDLTQGEILVFKAISDFVIELSSIFGNKKEHKSLLLYNRLIRKTKLFSSNKTPIRKHINTFTDFCIRNRIAIIQKNKKEISKDIYKLYCRLKNYINVKNYEEYEKIMGESLDLMLDHLNSFDLDWRENHIDHIFPRKAFVDYGITDPRIINCRDNLQVLTKHENCSKSGKYSKKKFEKYLTEHNF